MGEHACFDCGHAVADHSGEYRGWDSRSDAFDPVKREGTGCLFAGCDCRRWFEVQPAAPTQPDEVEGEVVSRQTLIDIIAAVGFIYGKDDRLPEDVFEALMDPQDVLLDSVVTLVDLRRDSRAALQREGSSDG